MQKSVVILVVLCALVFASRVEAFAVYLEKIKIGTTKENGGVPEIFVVCDGGDAKVLINLSNVDKPYITYSADPVIYIDKYLGVHEKHTCYIVESDSFWNDYDREDNHDDIYGYFTVSRSEFAVKKKIALGLPGEVAVLLGCEHC